MKNIDKKQMLEFFGAIVLIGVVLFITINTSEAKKLVGYFLTALTPFVYGFCIAYVLNLLVKQVDGLFAKGKIKRGKEPKTKASRVWSIIISILVFIAFAALTVGMIIPNLKDTVTSLYNQAPELVEKLIDFLDKIKVKYPALKEVITKLETMINEAIPKTGDWIKDHLSHLLTGALSKLKSAGNVLINFGIGCVIAFAMLIHKEWLVREVYMIMNRILNKKYYGYFCYVQEMMNKKFQIYLKYNLVQALITGAGTFLVMLVTGMPYKVSISLLITVTQLIPIIGAIAGTAVSALLIAAVSPVKAIIFVGLCIAVQQTVEKLINPHLIGKELDMPGVITFLAIVIGGRQFGLAGLICSVPLVSVFYDIYRLKLRPRMMAAIERKNETPQAEE